MTNSESNLRKSIEYLTHMSQKGTMNTPRIKERLYKKQERLNKLLSGDRVISSSNKRRYENREVFKYNMYGGFIREYKDIYALAEEIKQTGSKMDIRPIIRCCNGEGKSSYGCKWRFADEQD